MPTIREQKAAMRRAMKTVLSGISPEERDARSQQLCARLAEFLATWTQPVLTFASMPVEPNLDELWNLDLPWVFPKVVGKAQDLELYLVPDPSSLAPGAMGIREPVLDQCRKMDLHEVELILVPGLAFDQDDGARLGRGGGFYDRLLAGFKGETVGICFREQQVSNVPREPHDCRVTQVMAE